MPCLEWTNQTTFLIKPVQKFKRWSWCWFVYAALVLHMKRIRRFKLSNRNVFLSEWNGDGPNKNKSWIKRLNWPEKLHRQFTVVHTHTLVYSARACNLELKSFKSKALPENWTSKPTTKKIQIFVTHKRLYTLLSLSFSMLTCDNKSIIFLSRCTSVQYTLHISLRCYKRTRERNIEWKTLKSKEITNEKEKIS